MSPRPVSRPFRRVRPSEAAIGGGVAVQARAHIKRRQALVDALRSLDDDSVADVIERFEQIAHSPAGALGSVERFEMLRAVRELYARAGLVSS